MKNKIILPLTLLLSTFGQCMATAEDIFKALDNADTLENVLSDYTNEKLLAEKLQHNINFVDESGMTALDIALYQGQQELKQDLANDTEGRLSGMTPLEEVVYQGISESVIDVVKVLLKYGAQAKNHPVVYYALARHNNVELAELLLEAGQANDIKNLDGDTALMWALKNGKDEYIDLLLKYHKGDLSDLMMEADMAESLFKHCDKKTIEELLVKPNKKSGNLLPVAWAMQKLCQTKDKKFLKFIDLFSRYAPKDTIAHPDKQIMNGRKMLIFAIENLLYEAAKILIQNGADVNVTDGSGNDALVYANDYNQSELVTLILEKGGKINNKNSAGNTQLISACMQNRTDIAEILIKNKADLNFQNDVGRTALHYAIVYNNEKIVNVLLEHGANPNIIDNNGESAIAFLCRKNNENQALFTGKINKELSQYGVRSGLRSDRNENRNCYDLAVVQARPNVTENLKQIGELYEQEYNTPLFIVIESLPFFSGSERAIKALGELGNRGFRDIYDIFIEMAKKSNALTAKNIYGENALFVALQEIMNSLNCLKLENVQSIKFFQRKIYFTQLAMRKILDDEVLTDLSAQEKINAYYCKSSANNMTTADLCQQILEHPVIIAGLFLDKIYDRKEILKRAPEIINLFKDIGKKSAQAHKDYLKLISEDDKKETVEFLATFEDDIINEENNNNNN